MRRAALRGSASGVSRALLVCSFLSVATTLADRAATHAAPILGGRRVNADQEAEGISTDTPMQKSLRALSASDDLLKDRKPLDSLGARVRKDVYRELESLDTRVEEHPESLDEAMEINVEIIRRIGVNGALSIIEESEPGCHSTAHQVGRAAVRITRDLVKLLQACGSRCGMGCFHGVALGLIADAKGDGTVEQQQRVLQSLCDDPGIVESYGVGECLHAAGHVAVMIAEGHDADLSEEFCMAAFRGNRTKQHYCGTGVHMQLRPQHPMTLCRKALLPGACFMYGWRASYIISSRPKDVRNWAVRKRDRCLKLEGPEAVRLGCIFGLGSNAGERVVVDDSAELHKVAMRDTSRIVKDVCLGLQGELLAACVEGFLLRNDKYYPKGAAEAICDAMPGPGPGVEYSREDCMSASRLTQYDVARRVSRYVVEA